MEGTRFLTALVLGLDLQGTSVLLLAPLNLLPFFFFPPFSSFFPPRLFLLNIHWSRDCKPGAIPDECPCYEAVESLVLSLIQ